MGIKSKKPKSRGHSSSWTYEQFWFCCNCDLSGPGPMSLWNNQCPICGMLSCDTCVVECVKIKDFNFSSSYPPLASNRSTYTKNILGATSTGHTPSNFPSTIARSVIVEPFNPTATLIMADNAEKPTANAKPSFSKIGSPSLDPRLLDLIPNTMRKGYSDTPSDVSFSSSSPQPSEVSPISTDGNGTSNTDSDYVDNSDSSDDDIEMISGNAREINMVEAIDECILAACIRSLELATMLILQIHALLEKWAHNGVRSHASGTTYGEGSGSGAGSGSVRGDSGRSHGNHTKRGNDNAEGSGRPDKQPKLPVENGTRETGLPPGPLPTFACHFCKKDPAKYNFWANSKYKNCPHPSIPHNALRRIKDHFKVHLLSQCDRCYFIFKDKDALVTHRQMLDPCEKRPATLKEGIDDGQWEKITDIVKKATQKGRQDFEKWYDIWDVLFPNATQPMTPWNEPGCLSMNTSLDREAIMREIRAGVDRIDQGVLPRDGQLYRQIFDIIQRALAIQTSDSASQMTMPVSATESLAYEGLSVHQSNETYAHPIDDTNNSFDLNSILPSSDTEIFQGDESNFIQDQDRSQLSTNELFFGSSLVALDDNPLEDWIEALDIPLHATNPHPLISNFGNDPAFSDQGRVNESGLANTTTAENFDMDALLAQDSPLMDSLQDSRIDFDPFGLVEGQDETVSNEMPNDVSTTLDSELPDINSTITLKNKKHRNKGLKDRCEYDTEGRAIIYP